MNENFLHIHSVTCIFIIEIACVLLEFTKTKKKLVYRGFSKYVANTHGSFGF